MQKNLSQSHSSLIISNKPGTPNSIPSKSSIMLWLQNIVPQMVGRIKIEDLGNGIIYCKIINYYYPGSISINRLINNPHNQYQNILNLKQFSNAIVQMKINIPFNVNKIAKQKFLENWTLINLLYKLLNNSNNSNSNTNDNDNISVSSNSIVRNIKPTPKRSFEMAFPDQKILKVSSTHLNHQYSVYQNCLNKTNNTTESKGKWSVNSHNTSNALINNQNAVMDRIRQILLKASHDIEKIRQIKLLLNLTINQDVEIKIEEGEQQYIKYTNKQTIQSQKIKQLSMMREIQQLRKEVKTNEEQNENQNKNKVLEKSNEEEIQKQKEVQLKEQQNIEQMAGQTNNRSEDDTLKQKYHLINETTKKIQSMNNKQMTSKIIKEKPKIVLQNKKTVFLKKQTVRQCFWQSKGR